MQGILENHRVLVCTGSGGVGKTTVSAALGVLGARRGRRVLVLTIDPARRLAMSLGISPGAGATPVQDGRYAGQLFAEMIEPRTIFDDFVRRSSATEDSAQRILDNALYRQLSTTLSGSQEFTSLVKLHDAASSDKYDLVILDTPPTEHAIDFLEAPEKISALFDGAMVRWFVGASAGRGLFNGLLRTGAIAWLATLQLLTGSGFIRELTDFFECVGPMAEEISAKSRLAKDLLASSDTAFVLTAGLDEAKLREGGEFMRELSEAGFHLRATIVNRTSPLWLRSDQAPLDAALSGAASPDLLGLLQQMREYYRSRAAQLAALPMVGEDAMRMVMLPELTEDVHGLAALERIASELQGAGA